MTCSHHIDVQALIPDMDDLGESLHTAATELSADCTLERVDRFLSRLYAATNVALCIRKALAGPSHVHSGGTG